MNIFTKVPGLAQQTRYVQQLGPQCQAPAQHPVSPKSPREWWWLQDECSLWVLKAKWERHRKLVRVQFFLLKHKFCRLSREFNIHLILWIKVFLGLFVETASVSAANWGLCSNVPSMGPLGGWVHPPSSLSLLLSLLLKVIVFFNRTHLLSDKFSGYC